MAFFDFVQQFQECRLLFGRACVGGISVGVKPALVAYAQAVSVVVLAMRACGSLRAASLYSAVAAYHIMVAYAFPAAPAVPGVNLFRA